MSRLTVWIACSAGLLWNSGCTAPSRTGEVVRQTVSTPEQADRDALWKVAQNVLRDHRFDIDRLDRRAGIITTHPQTSKHFFEFWRKDVDTPYDFVEASLRTVRRTVTVNINPQNRESQLAVTVTRETFATPERQFNSSLAAFNMFGDQLPSEAGGKPVSRDDDYWIKDGRDPAMERYLLDQVLSAPPA